MKRKPDFDCRNYVDSPTYKSIVAMAKKNLEERQKNRKRSSELAVKRRRYKRGVENKFRRNNVSVLPSRNSVNTIVINAVSEGKIADSSFIIRAKIDGNSIDLLIDTGAHRTCVSQDLVNKLHLANNVITNPEYFQI